MEDILSLYAEPYDPQYPVLCFDERPCFLIGDEVDLDYAVEHTTAWVYRMDNDPDSPWLDGRHCGDCTKTAHTCVRCLYENALEWVDKFWDNERASDYVLRNENS